MGRPKILPEDRPPQRFVKYVTLAKLVGVAYTYSKGVEWPVNKSDLVVTWKDKATALTAARRAKANDLIAFSADYLTTYHAHL